MTSNPHEWTIQQDRDGFYLEDEYGEEPDGFKVMGRFHRYSYSSHTAAKTYLDKIVSNWEPPDNSDAWSGGFAENH